MSKEEDQIDSSFEDSDENIKEPLEESYSSPPSPIEQQEFGTDSGIIEGEDVKKKKKRKKIWLILIFAVILPILIIVGAIVFLLFLAAGAFETCVSNCGNACCTNCCDSCNESCGQSCDNACDSACDNACDSACSSCTCNCNNSSATITLKENINAKLNLVKWYFLYIFRIFRI